jgi:cytochrome c5
LILVKRAAGFRRRARDARRRTAACGDTHGFRPATVESEMKVIAGGLLVLATIGGAGTALAADGKAVYEKTCSVCHAAGVAGAPKFGDKAAWAPRIAQGKATLLQSALKGKNAMPPKGGNTALSDADVAAAVDYMTGAAK